MTDQEWLDLAIEFDVGMPPVINGYFMTPDVPDGGYHEHDRIVMRYNAETKLRKWAVLRGSRCLTKKGNWLYESMPSHRSGAFIKRTRFDTNRRLSTPSRWPGRKNADSGSGSSAVGRCRLPVPRSGRWSKPGRNARGKKLLYSRDPTT
jgi:hypothetical protein